jgi:hypothetical protein
MKMQQTNNQDMVCLCPPGISEGSFQLRTQLSFGASHCYQLPTI